MIFQLAILHYPLKTETIFSLLSKILTKIVKYSILNFRILMPHKILKIKNILLKFVFYTNFVMLKRIWKKIRKSSPEIGWVSYGVTLNYNFYLIYFLIKDVNQCSLNCLNGGSCLITSGTQKCFCSSSYTGTFCETCNKLLL